MSNLGTIKYDLIKEKDILNTFKYAYIEGVIQEKFYSDLSRDVLDAENPVQVCQDAKLRLKDVKRSGETIGDEIKGMSVEFARLKQLKKDQEEEMEKLERKLRAVERELKEGEAFAAEYEGAEKLAAEADRLSKEVGQMVAEIDEKKRELEAIMLEKVDAEIESMESKKMKLLESERRWSAAVSSVAHDELNMWYVKAGELLSLMCGFKAVSREVDNSSAVLTLKRGSDVKIVLRGQKLFDIVVSSSSEFPWFPGLKNDAMRLNDARAFLVEFAMRVR